MLFDTEKVRFYQTPPNPRASARDSPAGWERGWPPCGEATPWVDCCVRSRNAIPVYWYSTMTVNEPL